MFYDIKRREVIIHRYDVREKQNHHILNIYFKSIVKVKPHLDL